MSKTYYVDGFVLGPNPSLRGGGFTITDEVGKIIEKCTHHRKPGERAYTNNTAEFTGVARALELAEPGSKIITDSATALAWVRYGKSKARPDLSDQCAIACRMMWEKNIDVVWAPREGNLAGQHNEFGRIV